jgi:hypothetical protein
VRTRVSEICLVKSLSPIRQREHLGDVAGG